jgi:signal transduction histidine kinase
MLRPVSPEFITLCQAQVLLLTQALEAGSTVVYLAEQSSELGGPALVPLVAYPDDSEVWRGGHHALTTIDTVLPAAYQPSDSGNSSSHSYGSADKPDPSYRAIYPAAVSTRGEAASSPDVSWREDTPPLTSENPDLQSSAPQPMILPLAHEGVMLGVLVSNRDTSPWSQDEYQQAERVANSLAIACVMDQRNQWLQNQLQQRQLTQADQSQVFHDLLHQFRNPLTALQTFGKLLVKRIQVDDPNRTVAEGIVRETGRLQDLAQTFDNTLMQGDEDLANTSAKIPFDPPLLPQSDVFSAPHDQDPVPSGPNRSDSPPILLPEPDIAELTPAADLTDKHRPPASSQGDNHTLGRNLNLIPGSIPEVVEPLLISAAAIAQDRGLTLLKDIPSDLPEVWLDSTALQEVLSNLLDNAFKYSPQGTLIWVAGGLVQQLRDTFYQGIAIGDTGPGIPLQDQDHIFERHYRGIQADSETPGTGLGLAIVQDLVTAMGGSIDLISPIQLSQWLPHEAPPGSLGPGSLFIVWLKTV